MEDISYFVSSECWSMEVLLVGVRLPKGDLHLGDGIRGVADYPAEIRVKDLKLVNTLKGTSPQLLNFLCHQVMGHQQHTLYLNLKTT